MRTIIDIPEEGIKKLDFIAGEKGCSRAQIIRELVDEFTSNYPKTRDDAFGLWKGKKINSLEYEQKIRSEWE